MTKKELKERYDFVLEQLFWKEVELSLFREDSRLTPEQRGRVQRLFDETDCESDYTDRHIIRFNPITGELLSEEKTDEIFKRIKDTDIYKDLSESIGRMTRFLERETDPRKRDCVKRHIDRERRTLLGSYQTVFMTDVFRTDKTPPTGQDLSTDEERGQNQRDFLTYLQSQGIV